MDYLEYHPGAQIGGGLYNGHSDRRCVRTLLRRPDGGIDAISGRALSTDQNRIDLQRNSPTIIASSPDSLDGFSHYSWHSSSLLLLKIGV